MPKAYYNENDPKTAAWLRELIKQKLIADGDVDDRSIADVVPRDLDGYTQCHFFAGIGGWSLALRQAGWADDTHVWTGSCPCQPFSSAGRRKGSEGMTEPRLILSLCDFSGAWSDPYLEAGYKVIRIDLAHPVGETRISERLWTIGCDLTRFDFPWRPWAVLAAPSCTSFCRPGARWWKRMDESGQTAKDVDLFKQCLRLCATATGWWALENPPGRQPRLMPNLPSPAWQFQPWEYGDPWVKQTYIWGTALKPPVSNPVEPFPTRRTPNGRSQGRIAFMSSSWKREREKTPAGFAKAFFEANP